MNPELTEMARSLQTKNEMPVSESIFKAAHSRGANIVLQMGVFHYIVNNSLYNIIPYTLRVWFYSVSTMQIGVMPCLKTKLGFINLKY